MHVWLVVFMFYDMIILFGGANRIAMNAVQNNTINKVLEWNIRGGNAEYIYRY